MQVGVELKKLFERDLDRLGEELIQYSTEDDLWIKEGEISNSAGNLALHLCGNLKHFIGAVLSNSGYKRDRPFEFAGKVSLQDLEKEIKETKVIVSDYLDAVSLEELGKDFPIQPFGHPTTVSEFIFHLYGHFNYHLGQINYHRRLISRH